MAAADEHPLERVTLLLRSLGSGGAERQAVNLAKGLSARGVEVSVVLFYEEGELIDELAGAGIDCTGLGKSDRWISPAFVRRLVQAVRSRCPEVLYTFLEVPNVLGAALRACGVVRRIVWGIRSSDMDFQRYGARHAAMYLAQIPSSRIADGIVFNSEAGRRHWTRLGMHGDRHTVIPNGIDTDRFRPDAETRRRVRDEWDVSDDEQLVGIVARVDPMKDHASFLLAARRVAKLYPRVRFACVGAGTEGLDAEVARLGLGDRVRLSGRSDSATVMNALDCLVMSSSYGEGFPNVVGEAMACGTKCVVADVGDAARIVSDLGRVVPPSRPDDLADAILLELEADRDPEVLRRRIVEEFSIDQMVDATATFLAGVRR